nr:CMRF35-like molecule 5 [Misgurnus anguillicaudatus]
MKIYYVVYIWMFLTETRVSCTDGIRINGYIGKNAIFSCPHSWASTNRKYFCRDPCNGGDILVSSDRSPDRRFALKDYGTGTFTINITDLVESDSGIYWCGVSRFGKDTYYKVNLRVFKAITTTSTVLDTTHPFSTPQPEAQFSTSSRTSRFSTPDDITTSSSMTGTPNSKQIKSKKLKPKVSENLMLNTGQADDIYQNL